MHNIDIHADIHIYKMICMLILKRMLISMRIPMLILMFMRTFCLDHLLVRMRRSCLFLVSSHLFVLLLLPAVFPSRGGLTSVRGQGRSSASNLKLKTCPWEWVAPHPFGIASSTPAPAPSSQGWPQRVRGMQDFKYLLHAKTRRGALQKASPRT